MEISIITINYNNAVGLKKTIESILSQNYKAFEYIVIDGGSTDESLDLIKNFQHQISYWESEKDNGIYDAMNKGIKKSTGKYLMFLNSGDCLSKNDVLEICIENINSHKKVDIFYGDIYGVSEKKTEPWVHKHPSTLDLLFWKENNINHQSALIKKSLFNEFGLYPEAYKLAGDHWIFFKSFLADKIFQHIPTPLIVYDYSGVSATGREKYYKEMEKMWDSLLPLSIRELANAHKKAMFDLNKKPVKAFIKLHNNLHKIKSRIKNILSRN